MPRNQHGSCERSGKCGLQNVGSDFGIQQAGNGHKKKKWTLSSARLNHFISAGWFFMVWTGRVWRIAMTARLRPRGKHYNQMLKSSSKSSGANSKLHHLAFPTCEELSLHNNAVVILISSTQDEKLHQLQIQVISILLTSATLSEEAELLAYIPTETRVIKL